MNLPNASADVSPACLVNAKHVAPKVETDWYSPKSTFQSLTLNNRHSLEVSICHDVPLSRGCSHPCNMFKISVDVTERIHLTQTPDSLPTSISMAKVQNLLPLKNGKMSLTIEIEDVDICIILAFLFHFL